MTPSQELDKIIKERDRVVANVAKDLLSELIQVTPVKSGTLKGAWYIEKIVGGWRISNNMQYASVIFDGRRIVAGREYGSIQLPGGLDPILAKYNIIMQQELNKIK